MKPLVKATLTKKQNTFLETLIENGGNVIDERLFPSKADAASTGYNNIDILSNGFKTRNGSDDGVDASGSTYIYMAFAEAPFVNSKGVPCNAR